MNAVPPSIDRYAVLGNPIEHSRSPFIHAAFARQTGERLNFGRLLCPLDGFEAALRAYADGGARGCSVTVPFKFEARRLAPRCSPRAELAGAANLLRFDREGWWADNTDGVGLVRDIESGAGVALRGTRVLLLGAGGAAAGILGPLLTARPGTVVVANRSPDRAAALVERHAELAGAMGVAVRACGLAGSGTGFDVVLNASASSLNGAVLPLGPATLGPGALAVDLMYGPAAEPFLVWARAAGAQARDGLGMLVEQAAEAFYHWRGVRPLTAPVLQALRTAPAPDVNPESQARETARHARSTKGLK